MIHLFNYNPYFEKRAIYRDGVVVIKKNQMHKSALMHVTENKILMNGEILL